MYIMFDIYIYIVIPHTRTLYYRFENKLSILEAEISNIDGYQIITYLPTRAWYIREIVKTSHALTLVILVSQIPIKNYTMDLQSTFPFGTLKTKHYKIRELSELPSKASVNI